MSPESQAHDSLLAVVTFPRDAILTIEQVALALQLCVSRVEKMDLPTIYCGKRHRRYLWSMVLDNLAERAAKGAEVGGPLIVTRVNRRRRQA